MLANPDPPPTATSTAVGVGDRAAPSGKAAETVTRRVPASSANVVCAPEVSGSASADRVSRPAGVSASANVIVRLAASGRNPAGTAAFTVTVSFGSSNPSAVPDRVNEPWARGLPAGITTVKSLTTS